MQKYKVIAEEGIQLEENAVVKAKDEIIELDPEAEATKNLITEGLIKIEEAMPTAIDDGPFQVKVLFEEAATPEQRQLVADGVQVILQNLKENPQEFDGVISLTIEKNS